ncbi:23S rRNA (guanosine-2'-O-) -methyltransferase rlmB [Rhodobacter sp. AKP1]|nr:23S rRNA (guanosine-2'-O-) -methyltransferase rlmB [Rhodobacter sp. AKP1]
MRKGHAEGPPSGHKHPADGRKGRACDALPPARCGGGPGPSGALLSVSPPHSPAPRTSCIRPRQNARSAPLRRAVTAPAASEIRSACAPIASRERKSEASGGL